MCGILLLVVGVIVLVKGEVKLTRTRVARGGPAYVVGALLALPLPLAFGIGLVYGVMMGARNQPIDPKALQAKFAPIELGIDIACLLGAVIIAAVTAKPVGRRPAAPVDDEYVDEYRRDEPRGRRPDNDLDQP
jgi:hypothetical protein